MGRSMLRGRLFPLWVLTVLLLVGSMIGASVGSAVLAAGRPALAQDNIVISEFRPHKVGSSVDDEFVEIFNRSHDTAFNVGSWLIRSINNIGVYATVYTFPAGQSISPGQYYLVAGNAFSGAVNGTFSGGGIPPDGGISITLPDETIVDMAGVNFFSAEGAPLLPLPDPTQSYERLPGGSLGSCNDTNNNLTDFGMITVPDPRNLGSPLTVCAAPTDTPSFTPSDTSNATFTPSGTPTNTPTFTPTASGTPTQVGTPLGSKTATPSAPTQMVISEFRTRGPYGADDEFVELYNPTGASINIGGWVVRRSSSCGTSTSNLVTILSGTILVAGQHFLLATVASHIAAPDQAFSPGISDDGGLALVNASSVVVDQVGMCISTLYREGINLSPLTGFSDQSYERLPGGSTACYDLNNNVSDFVLHSPATPLNKASPVVMCAGVPVFTPTKTPTRTPTRTFTPTNTTVPGTVVINEFLPHPNIDWNGDGLVNTGDEYIELMNMGTAAINLKNWRLDNGVGGPSVPFVLPDMTLLPHQIVVFFHSTSGIGLSDGGGTVRLLKSDGRTADINNYPLVEAVDVTWCRLPDGRGAWGFVCLPTPGKPNAKLSAGTIVPGSPSGTVVHPVDPICLANTAPQAVLTAECESPGASIWENTGAGEFWLVGKGKWPVIFE